MDRGAFRSVRIGIEGSEVRSLPTLLPTFVPTPRSRFRA